MSLFRVKVEMTYEFTVEAPTLFGAEGRGYGFCQHTVPRFETGKKDGRWTGFIVEAKEISPEEHQ